MLNTETPYKIYAEVLEETARQQFEDCLNMEGCVRGALMPDAHTGYTAPIGSVLKFKDVVSPALIGYDIGCGVCASKLNITKDDIDLNQLKEYILSNIPIGFNAHKQPQKIDLDDKWLSEFAKEKLNAKGYVQLGTLGGGNHFIEIGESNTDGKLWIVIHSGSRGFGHGVAEHYMQEASEMYAEPFNEQEAVDAFVEHASPQFREHNPKGFKIALHKAVVKAKKAHGKKLDIEGHFGFDINSEIGKAYLNDMDYCLEYALLNRHRMVGKTIEGIREQTSCEEVMFINRNHNHAEIIPNGYVIHRKGATHAEKGMWGVIPANMRDGAFIVRGKGNYDSMCSSSHGAGRVLSRAQARKTLDVDDFIEEMGKIVTNHTEKMLDESPEAYKNIFEVMELQKDLVEVIERSIPILNIKG